MITKFYDNRSTKQTDFLSLIMVLLYVCFYASNDNTVMHRQIFEQIVVYVNKETHFYTFLVDAYKCVGILYKLCKARQHGTYNNSKAALTLSVAAHISDANHVVDVKRTTTL